MLGLVPATSWATAAPRIDTLCLETCQACLPAQSFTDWSADVGAGVCGSWLALESTYLCMREYCTVGGIARARKEVKDSCGEGVPGYEIVDGHTDEDVRRLRRVSYDDAVSGRWEEIVLPEEHLFDLWWRTLVGVSSRLR
jgi:hypothetical protein